MILLIDNYDSFTYNLAQYIGNFAEVQVLRNDDPTLYEEATKADGLVFSPGPSSQHQLANLDQEKRPVHLPL